nr:unnamed protein product [Digitaria exilis]
MEAIDPHVEDAVLWLAQTILEVLFAGEMEAWIRRIGLADDTERLKSEVEMVEAVVGAAKGRVAGNRPLVRSLGRLKELLYDADDMVDELDYYRLQHQVEGGVIAWDCDDQPQGTDVNGGAQLVDGSRDNSGILNKNDRKKRSKAWEEFNITEEDATGKPVKAECIHCGTQVKCETSKGTSVLHNHLKSDSCKRKRAAIEQTPNPSSADDGAQNGATILTHDSDRRKRMRSDEGNKEGFSGFTSLEELTIRRCPKLIPSLVQKYQNNDPGNGRWLLPHSLRTLDITGSPEMLQPCFLEGGNCLIKLVIDYSPSLKILQLCFCTALEELIIHYCESLAALEGNFTCLKELVLGGNSGLESLELYSCTSLEELMVASCEALTALEGNFTSLRKLDLSCSPRLKLLRLGFCTALEHLEIYYCHVLDTLEDLGSLRGLSKRLLLPTAVLISLQRAGIMDILVKIARAISDALRDPEKLPRALILCGIVEAAAALSLVFFRVPGGRLFLGHHHGDKQALVYVYYGVLGAVVAFGLGEASMGFWVSGDPVGRRAVGMTMLWVSVLPLVIVAGLAGGLSSAASK